MGSSDVYNVDQPLESQNLAQNNCHMQQLADRTSFHPESIMTISGNNNNNNNNNSINNQSTSDSGSFSSGNKSSDPECYQNTEIGMSKSNMSYNQGMHFSGYMSEMSYNHQDSSSQRENTTPKSDDDCSPSKTSKDSHRTDGGGKRKDGSKKRRLSLTEDIKQDQSYWDKRRKNNESAKRSRDARRMKEEQIAMRVVYLEQENLQLRTEAQLLKNEIEKLRCMLYNTH